ncbi:MAG: hypothetical protein WCO63_01300 [Bacteroidota bacterium]
MIKKVVIVVILLAVCWFLYEKFIKAAQEPSAIMDGDAMGQSLGLKKISFETAQSKGIKPGEYTVNPARPGAAQTSIGYSSASRPGASLIDPTKRK